VDKAQGRAQGRAAVVTAPAALDTTSNAAPFFVGLDNLRVVAGETLEIRFVPRDPEGELPGMFPQELIAVDAPDDPAEIPNVAPGIKEVLPFTVRAGDPVVIEIEGVDRNGTLPSVELESAPAGASLLPHPRFDDRHVLRFVPPAAGELIIDVVVRDAVDTSLTATESISLTVETPANFVRSGTRLKELAANQGVNFGFAASPELCRCAGTRSSGIASCLTGCSRRQ